MSVNPFLEVRDLTKHFAIRRGLLRRKVGAVRAVDGVSFQVQTGETLGIVGESGCGKSTTARAIMRLLRPTSGQVCLDGVDLATIPAVELRRRRRDFQMIFQDPYGALDPRMPAGALIREPLDVHRIGTGDERRARVLELLDLVGLDATIAGRYPHQLSGGQRQRVGIARALATGPRLVIADEPLSALDVSIQAQVVNLLRDLRDQLGLTYVLIAHDLSMVRYLSDRVAVMYLGRIVEIGDTDRVFDEPLHPYTDALLAAAPVPDPSAPRVEARRGSRGDPPSPANLPSGCRFHTRCPVATAICAREDPPLAAPWDDSGTHLVACHHPLGEDQ